MSMAIKRKNLIGENSGYVLLELLFYISFFAAMSLAVVSALITMAGSFQETAILAKLSESVGIMERIVREIRGANDFVVITAEDIELNTTDEFGVAKTIEFLLDGTDVKLLEDDVLIGSLNAPGMSVSALSFTQITTSAGKAVKISLSLGSENDKLGRTFDFYDTIVLRGSY
ncbi:MAG TPA: hypothetical protein VJL32_02400 [Candidatus Paceibacterota bacterium]